MTEEPAAEPTDRMLSKLRDFVADLDTDERAAFAALVGPGVALAYRDDDDVEGFGLRWGRQQLPDRLAESVRRLDLRVEGL